jgi:hypothetical protein
VPNDAPRRWTGEARPHLTSAPLAERYPFVGSWERAESSAGQPSYIQDFAGAVAHRR